VGSSDRGFRFRVWNLGFRIRGLGFRVDVNLVAGVLPKLRGRGAQHLLPSPPPIQPHKSNPLFRPAKKKATGDRNLCLVEKLDPILVSGASPQHVHRPWRAVLGVRGWRLGFRF